jgi:hypothetical protein
MFSIVFAARTLHGNSDFHFQDLLGLHRAEINRQKQPTK